jgi:hypothetical protein
LHFIIKLLLGAVMVEPAQNKGVDFGFPHALA